MTDMPLRWLQIQPWTLTNTECACDVNDLMAVIANQLRDVGTRTEQS